MDNVLTTSLPFAEWLPRQRWYAGRTRRLTSATVAEHTALDTDLDHVLIDVHYDSGPGERYQVLVRWSDRPLPDVPEAAVIGSAGDRVGHDALHHRDSASRLMRMCAESAVRGSVVFTAEPDVTLPVDAAPRVSTAEQSNTSVVFGDAAILKVFRQVHTGINPDVELNRVLGRAGNRSVARLLASFDTTWDGQPCPLGMVTAFAAGAEEGWALATAAARRHVVGEGGDFTTHARRLGAAVASIHAGLATELGTSDGVFPVEVAVARLEAARASVPQLEPYAAAIAQRFESLAGEPITMQRVHGDLHLGQVLRTGQDWLVIDFEGEPGAPLDERRRPDSPLRDVAGMLRSFDYAAHLPILEEGTATGASPAAGFSAANQAAFCAGYADVAGRDPRDDERVLVAYELDKAVYEAAYEARYRPDWLPIPLRAIAAAVDSTR